MKLVYGRAGCGKSTFCMNEIKQSIEKQESSTMIYIVPEQYSLGAEFALTKMLQHHGTINIQVLSMKRLAYRVMNELGYHKNFFNNASKSMLIDAILLTQEKNLKVLKGVSKNRGLVDTVSDLIAECKRYQITWEMLQDVKVENAYLQLKLQDIALIYRLFEEKMTNRYFDTDSRFTVLSQLIPKSTMLKGAKIWIDEFDSFTPQEFAIIEALEKVADVTVALTLEKKENTSSLLRNELFRISQKTYEKLQKDNPLEEIEIKGTKRFMNEELAHLEQNFFCFPYMPYEKPTKFLHLSIENNFEQEMETVAQTICQKVRKEGLRFENIAVLTREIDQHKTVIRKVFEKYHLPFFFDDKKELSMQPLLTLVTSLFDMIPKNYSYDAMFQYLKTGLTNMQDLNDIDCLENYVLQFGIRGQKWSQAWEYPSDNLEKINLLREAVMTPILTFKNALKGKKTVKEITTTLFLFLQEIGVDKVIQKKAEDILQHEKVSSSELETANTSIQVWNILMEIFDELVNCLGEEAVSFENYRNILLEGISKHQIGILPTAKDQVMIGDVARTRNSNIKVLFVIGINDGVFPKSFASEGFLNDQDRDTLLAQGIELAKNTKMLLLEENFHIYQALTTPSQELYLSYPITSSDGGVLRPSTIVQQIRNIFPALDVKNHVLHNNKAFYTPESVFPDLLQKMRDFFDGKEMSPQWQNAYWWYQKHEPEKLNKVKSGFDYQNTIESLDQNHSRQLYGKELYGSVSRLESYANCPFSYYLRYGLKLKERKVFQLETPDVGLFLHDILDAFAKYFMQRNQSLRDVSREEADKVVSQLVDESLASFKHQIFSSSEQMKVLSVKLKRVVKRMVLVIINHMKSGEFEVEGTEIDFGKGKQFSAVEIELSDGNKLVLSGVIDRMDIAKTEEGKYVRIIDYKSYNKELKLSDIYYGLQLQLLVYMDAVMENQGESTTEEELLPGGMLYLKLDDPMITTKKNISPEEVEEEIAKNLRMKGVILSDARLLKAMDSHMTSESSVLDLTIKKDGSYSANVPAANKEQWEQLMQHMKKILKQMGDEILSGKIPNEPVKKKTHTSCDYCDYRLVCQFDKDLGNHYRVIHDLKNAEVLEKMKS